MVTKYQPTVTRRKPTQSDVDSKALIHLEVHTKVDDAIEEINAGLTKATDETEKQKARIIKVLPVSTGTAAIAGSTNAHQPVDATSAARTYNLPSAPSDGDMVSIEKTDTSANAVSIAGNIRGNPSATPIALDKQSQSLALRADASGSWWPFAGHLTRTALDALYKNPDASQIGNLEEAVEDWVANMLVITGNATGSYNDTLGKYTINFTGGNAAPDAAAVATLADMSGPPDETITAGWPTGDSRTVVSSVLSANICYDYTSPKLDGVASVDLMMWNPSNNTHTVLASASTSGPGGYRAVFPGTVAYPAGAILTVVPTTTGGTGGTLRHRIDGTAWPIPAAPGKPTNVMVAVDSGVATVTWGAPASGTTPWYYTVTKLPGNGNPARVVGIRCMKFAVAIPNHTTGDKYAVEAVIPGRGSGLTLYVGENNISTNPGPAFITRDSTSAPAGSLSTTAGGDFVASTSTNSSSASFVSGGSRKLVTGTVSGSHQYVRLDTLPIGDVVVNAGFLFKDIVSFPDDTAAGSWLLFSSDSDPVLGTSTKFFRLNLSNASFTLGAKAPGQTFGTSTTASGYAVHTKRGGGTSTTVPSIGGAGIVFVVQVFPVGDGTWTINVYTAAVADYATAYPGSPSTTLQATYDLTSAQATALFSGTFKAWEVGASGSATVHSANFGPKVSEVAGGQVSA